jgi:hypothetical protein
MSDMVQIPCYDSEFTREDGGLITFGFGDPNANIVDLTVEDAVTGATVSVCLNHRALSTLVVEGAAALRQM